MIAIVRDRGRGRGGRGRGKPRERPWASQYAGILSEMTGILTAGTD